MTNMFSSLCWDYLFGWMPLSLQIVFFGFFAISLVIAIIRFIGMILNAIPFL